MPCLPHCIDDVGVCLLCCGEKDWDEFGRILKIDVERDHDVAPTAINPGRQSCLMPDIAA